MEVRQPKAIEIALRALDKPMDESLDFLLELIAREQTDVWLPLVLKGDLKLNDNPKHLVYAMKATGRSEGLKPLLASFKAGHLAAEDTSSVLAMAGDAADAAQVLEISQLVNDSTMSSHVVGLMDALVKAGTTRGVKPDGAAAFVQGWLTSPRAEIVHRACILAGAWKIEPSRPKLEAILTEPATAQGVRDGAIQGLARLGGSKARDFFDKLFQQNAGLRPLAVQGLTDVGPQLAAKRAIEFFATAKTAAEAAPVLTAFLKNKQLPGVLAKELGGKIIPDFVAVEGIRMVSTRGLKGPLEEALRTAGGVKQMNQALTPEQMTAMVEKVKSMGDPARGEAIYRRQQLLCQSCHAIGDAGGVLGPNLVSIGGSAPVDYLIESLLEPSKKIKEGYHMILISTKDGKVFSGGLVQDGGDEVIIRDPANQLQKIPKAQIANRQMSPASMMPAGLTASLREDEFIDLVRFLSELGREGAYKIKPNNYVRTWKVMGTMDQPSIDHVRHVGLHALHEKETTYPWEIRFSQVSGELPLSEVLQARMYPWFPKIARFSLKLATPGKVKLGLNAVKNVNVVVGDKAIPELTPELTLDLPAGITPVSIIISREATDMQSLRVELLEGAAQAVAD
jgi:putative heme-binding domain-containing protein